jgi:hypothetical protein
LVDWLATAHYLDLALFSWVRFLTVPVFNRAARASKEHQAKRSFEQSGVFILANDLFVHLSRLVGIEQLRFVLFVIRPATSIDRRLHRKVAERRSKLPSACCPC